MVFTIIYLNVYQKNDLTFKKKDSQLTIQKEQLYDAYDFIILKSSFCNDHVNKFLENQGYYCYNSDIVNHYYMNNKLKNIDRFYCDKFGYIMDAHFSDKYLRLPNCPEFLQDRLPCFMHGYLRQLDIEYLSNFFKITEINTNHIYYIERKNINIKAAIKRT
ncbi:hypothetical protein Hokovirus_2_38 [Hokovirus HKV1]|uniref:Uncharacterized protein n=1 Tax=Hokovirus HKV1 TaxID=1977638 RepID=A0A1V0SFQ4_9VIRU|nr:hypothetical protein Hokovirus_2_38 [Hokovirus HKV1]